MPEDFLFAALAILSFVGVVLLFVTWIASRRFEDRHPIEYKEVNPDATGSDDMRNTLSSVTARGVTLRDLVALGLIAPATTTRGPARKKKPSADNTQEE